MTLHQLPVASVQTLVPKICRIPPIRTSSSQLGISRKDAENCVDTHACPVQFNREQYALVFPEKRLDQAIASSDKELAKTLQRYLEIMETPAADTIAKINYQIERSLTFGNCNADSIALMLSMHRRTLHRTLLKHGTTFTELLEQCRRRKVEFLLQDTQMQVTAIAENLGYSDLTSFNHAFKKWYGMPPNEYRRHPHARKAVQNSNTLTPSAEAAK